MSSPNELSFLPEDYLQRKARRRTNLVCALLFTVVVGGISCAFVMRESSLKEVQKREVIVDREFTAAAERIKQVQQMQEKQRTMSQQAELTSALLEKVPRSFLLAEITNALPAGVSLTDLVLDTKKKVMPTQKKSAFEQKKPGPPSRASTPTRPVAATPSFDVVIKISGVAGDDVEVSQFIGKLAESRLLKDVNLIITDAIKQGDTLMRKFQIEMALNPAADANSLSEKPRSASVQMKQ